jgi:hypothetical protein
MQSGAASEGTAGANGGWRQVETGFTWEDLVLPEPQEAILQSVSATLESGGRLRLLFRGGPGTGKTMACQILGARCDVPVLSLDASGKDAIDAAETEELLRAAGRVGAVVVVDHAEQLLRGRRVSRHSSKRLDGPAMLGRTQAHGGAVVFTSSSTRGVDNELLAQFDAVVDFPFPDRHVRKAIWRRLLPGDSRLTDADLEHVAGAFRLPGVAIRECCTLSALAAEAQAVPVTLAHVTRAIELEYSHRLTSDSTYAALDELRRRAGLEEDADLPAAPAEPPPAAARRPRAALRMPRRPRRPGLIRPSRHLLRATVLVVAAIVIAAVGFVGGRVTSSQRTEPAAAKHISAAATPAPTTPTAPTTPAAPARSAPAGAASASYATTLTGIIFPLHRTRLVLMARLRQTPSWTVAAAQAAQLASAYTAAATRLRGIDAGSAAAPNAALATAFTQTAAALSALRKAELDRSHSARVSALAALRRANAAGAAAYADLHRLGYSVPVGSTSSG